MPSREIIIVLCTFAIAYYLGSKGILNKFIPGMG